MSAENHEIYPSQRESAEQLSSIATGWLALPLYTSLSKTELQSRSLAEHKGEIEAITTPVLKRSHELLGQMGLGSAFEHLTREIASADANIPLPLRSGVLRKLFYRRGVIQGNAALDGEYSSLSFEDPKRKIVFFSAAVDFMRADLAVGMVSDYGLYIGKMLDGAQVPGIAQEAYRKVLGPNVHLVFPGSPDDVVAQSARKTGESQITEIGGVVRIEKIKSGQNPQLN